VGIFRYGTSGNLAGATIIAFETATVQQLLLKPGRYNNISVMAAPGVTQDQLAARVKAVVPTATVKTGTQTADEAQKQISTALNFINIFLLVFAAVALFVGTFIILNTFSMLVVMRTHELGLLRAIGASRRQITASVLGEATVVGAVGGVVGLGAGILLAGGLQVLFSVIGFAMPTVGLTVLPRTIIVALVLGLVVTILAAYLPARRASRIPPVAAMRLGTTSSPAATRRRTIIGGAVLVVGAALLVVGSVRGKGNIQVVGLGAAAVLGAVLALGPALAPMAVNAMAWPFRRSLTARIAARNATRNPRRTSTTAAALMIGIALVGAFGTLASSTKASTDAVINDVLRTDFLVTPKGVLPFSPDVAKAVAAVPGVGLVSAVQQVAAQVDGQTIRVAGVDPATILDVVQTKVVAGSVGALASAGVMVDDKLAASKSYKIGAPLTVLLLSGAQHLKIAAIYTGTTGFSGYAVANTTLIAAGLPNLDFAVYVKASPGQSATALRAPIVAALAAYPTVKVQNLAEYKASLRGQIDQLLALIYALLGLAVTIAVLGIVNTLALSVVERTREIGLLRAIGTTRRQLRRLIRGESILIYALLGLAVTIAVLGIGLGIAGQQTLASQGIDHLAIPWSMMIIVAVADALVGVLASLWPARRAAKLDVLRAVSSE
jgi:putative ABC transport system permease protein